MGRPLIVAMAMAMVMALAACGDGADDAGSTTSAQDAGGDDAQKDDGGAGDAADNPSDASDAVEDGDSDAARASGDAEEVDGADAERASLCLPYLGLQAIEQARFTFTEAGDVAAVEAERQALLTELAEVLGPDAPPGVQGGIDTLKSDYPITAQGSEFTDAIDEAFASINGYVGPICDQPTGTGEGEPGAPLQAGDPQIVTLGGVGAISIGQPIEEAAALIGFDATEPQFVEESEFCAYMAPSAGFGYDGLDFMVYDGVVQRVDVYLPGPETPSGIGVGSTVDDVVSAYGDQVTFSPHPYDEFGDYVTFTPTDPGNEGLLLLFEITDGVVSSYRAGFAEPVNFIEGCA